MRGALVLILLAGIAFFADAYIVEPGPVVIATKGYKYSVFIAKFEWPPIFKFFFFRIFEYRSNMAEAKGTILFWSILNSETKPAKI